MTRQASDGVLSDFGADDFGFGPDPYVFDVGAVAARPGSGPYYALPATGGYVPSTEFRATGEGTMIDSAGAVLATGLVYDRYREADWETEGGTTVTIDWVNPQARDRVTEWAHNLWRLRTIPSQDAAAEYVAVMLCRETETATWCEHQSQTALVFTTVEDLFRGKWHTDPVLSAGNPDDLDLFLTHGEGVDYYWWAGDRHSIRDELDTRLPREDTTAAWPYLSGPVNNF